MKTILVTLLLLSSFNLYAAEAAKTEPHPVGECQGDLDEGTVPATPSARKSDKAQYPGTDALGTCEEMSRGNIAKLYSATNKGVRTGGNFDWDKYMKRYCCKNSKTEEKYNNCRADAKKEAMACESVAYLISAYGRDWTNQEQIAAATNSDNNQQAQKGATAQQVVANTSSGITCRSMGIETLDYDACRKFQVQLGLLDGAQQVGYATQELVYKDKIMDSQTKYSADENAATGALKAQGESLKMQQDMFNQRTAVDGAKLAYLYSIYNEMPTGNDIIAKCEGMSGKNIPGINEPITTEFCADSAKITKEGFGLVMNQAQIPTMRSKLISIATSAGSNLILANLLGKRADDVNNAIAKIDAYKPVDPFTVTEQDALSTFCKQNPGAPQCLTGGLERTFDTLNDNVITFGDGGTGTSYNGINSITDATTTSGATDGTSRSSVTPVGSIIAGAAKDNSIEGSSAAKVTDGAAGGGSGGGGGGASGGGGGGGGGNPQAPAQGGVAAAVQGKTPTYGGGSGSISVMGGFGINKKKADAADGENPFGKMFGKDAPKGSGVVNFRDIASKVGGKGDNIFDMISKRYTSVAADKRLLEYELAK